MSCVYEPYEDWKRPMGWYVPDPDRDNVLLYNSALSRAPGTLPGNEPKPDGQVQEVKP